MSKRFVAILCVLCCITGVLGDELFHLREENSELLQLNAEIRKLREVVTHSKELAEMTMSTSNLCMLTLSECSNVLDRTLPVVRKSIKQLPSESPNGDGSGAFEEGLSKRLGSGRKRRLEASGGVSGPGGRGGPLVPDIPVVQLTEVPE